MWFLAFLLGEALRKFLPKVDRRIGSPRFDHFQIKIGMKREHALEDQVGAWKGIRVADRSQTYVFSRPRSQSLGLDQRFAKHHRVLSFRKKNRSAQHAAAEIANRLFARRACSHFAQVGARQDRGSGK